MSTKKEFFDEPLVRVDTLKARFPKICPVCGSPATKIVRMKMAKKSPQYLRRQWNPAYTPYMVGRNAPHNPEMKVFPVQVCEDHANPDAGSDRPQTLCLVVDGFLLGFLIFGLLFMGNQISRGQPISIWPILTIGLFAIAMLLSLVAFMPNALAKAVQIVGFDAGMQNVLIAFKNPVYRVEFMKLNQMTAELVSWIMKADN